MTTGPAPLEPLDLAPIEARAAVPLRGLTVAWVTDADADRRWLLVEVHRLRDALQAAEAKP